LYLNFDPDIPKGEIKMNNASFSVTETINAPAANVYAYVADLPRHIEWNNQPIEMERLTNGSIAVGSKFRTREGLLRDLPATTKFMFTYFMPILRKIYGFSEHTFATITALEPNYLVAWKAHLPGRKGDMMRMNWEIAISEESNVQCVVTQRCQIVPPDSSPFARMVNDEMVETSRKETTANLLELKRILESG
jgi:hypothetical protein